MGLCGTLPIKDLSHGYLVVNMSLWTVPGATDIVVMVLPKMCLVELWSDFEFSWLKLQG